MLNIMRRNAGSWVIKIALSLIVLVFMFWGVGNFKVDRSSEVAVVNGEVISLQEYRRVYDDLIEQCKETDLVTRDIVNELKSFALNRIIDHKLLLQQAVKIGLCVTDQELINSIQSNTLFLLEGVFDISRYHAILSSLGFTPDQFETRSREFLLMKKFISMLYGSTKISDLEILNWYDWRNSLVNISYVLFDPDIYKNKTYDSEEICDYFEQHKQNYKTNCMRKLCYVVFDPNDFLNEDIIDEYDIVQYFKAHPEIFTTEKTVNVSHILIRTDIDSKSESQAEERIRDIFEMANKDHDFGELAKLYSECPSSQNRGLLGDISYDSVVDLFAEKAFSMISGEVGSPIKTQFGWHIIKVNSINEAKNITLDNAREEIKTRLSKSNADITAYNKAVMFLENCFTKDDLRSVAEIYSVNTSETDWFDDKGPAEFGEHNASVAFIVSSMQIGQISDVHEFNGNYLIMQLCDKIDSEIPIFENVKSTVVKDFESYKRQTEAKAIAETFIETVNSGKTMEDSAKLYGKDLYYTGFFKRDESVTDIDFEEKLLKDTLNILLNEGDLTPSPIKGEKGFYVASLVKKNKPNSIADLNNMGDEKEHISNILLGQKQSSLLSKLLEMLRLNGKITLGSGYSGV